MTKEIISIAFIKVILFSLNNYAQLPESNIPIRNNVARTDTSTNLTKFLNEKTWSKLFPNRYGIGLKDTIKNNPDFYSFNSFVTAAKAFPDFLSEGGEQIQKRELLIAHCPALLIAIAHCPLLITFSYLFIRRVLHLH